MPRPTYWRILEERQHDQPAHWSTRQSSLDRFLVSTIGFADIGSDVVGSNADPLANLMHVLVPTTDLTNEYHEALNCTLTGMIDFVRKPPNPLPGCLRLGALTLGIERYRYPQDLPKVAGHRVARSVTASYRFSSTIPAEGRRGRRNERRPATAIRASC